jgi:MFS family permease
VYNAGQAVGTLFAGWTADKFSRRYTLTIASAIAIVGILLSVIGTNAGMFIAGRLLTGWSSGMILPVSAIYMAEVSKPKNRGIIVGFQGMGTAVGFFLANWIGYSGIFFEGNLQWRFPLSLQFPCAVLMLIGSLVVLPFTPRWLISQDRFEEARAVLARIHSDEGEDYIDQEMIQIREQTALDRSFKRVGGEKWYSNFLMLFRKQYIKRLGFVCFIQALTQFGGVSVIRKRKSSPIVAPRLFSFELFQNISLQTP